jgi:hypothetical protein
MKELFNLVILRWPTSCDQRCALFSVGGPPERHPEAGFPEEHTESEPSFSVKAYIDMVVNPKGPMASLWMK